MSNIPETGRTPRVKVRMVVIQVLVFSLLLTLGGRLWYLQIRNGQEYTQEADKNHVQQVVQPAVRGSVVDDRGVPLADNETRLVVSASRTELLKQPDDGKAVLTRLAGVLGMKPADAVDKVRLCDAKTPRPCWNGSPYQPIPITDKATTQQALQIMEQREDFPGITAEPTAVRSYPGPVGVNAAQVLGYLGPVTDKEVAASEKTDNPLLRSDNVGRAGLESEYDQQLRGKSGVTRYEVDNLGRVIGKAGATPAQPGSNLVTSIDSRVQAITEKELAAAMKGLRQQYDPVSHKNFKADSGAAVVMDVHTGRVIAMASNPTYNPNVWTGGISSAEYNNLTNKKSNYPLLNRATQGESAPGSTFKVISTSAAINAGYNPNGGYPCTSSMTVGGRVFKNFEGENYGDINIAKALEVSCDTVFYDLAYDQWKKDGGINAKHPKDWFFKTAHAFGLGKKTGIDLPNEVSGRVPDRQWKQSYWDANKAVWCKDGKKSGSYVQQIEFENCKDGYQVRPGDSLNYAIGQGDTLLTPIQEAVMYSAIANGGTMYQPSIGKAVISADGKKVTPIKPKVSGHLPDTRKTISYINKALEGVVTSGTAAWQFGGWPQDKIALHAKTGTAEVAGKQSTGWLATYTKDYAVIMTISQGGTGSGAAGPAVRKIYESMYGIGADGKINPKAGILPKPVSALPKIQSDGSIEAPSLKPYKMPQKKDPVDPNASASPGTSTAPTASQPPAGTGDAGGGTSQVAGAELPALVRRD
ncbi:penicillin-binding protein 2 [Streptomyces sp. 8L]|uniref:penicillin-binding protein 2 n=1 Tax=Streptomyces sp. 8L TaxID=2877242 RepID=UPI001CD3B736|nr:penicillin-binding protein 2 [Streptomyces sp. 8L]MCA1218344.1 penicillin-binding protein 2 [Streptomyces sp. 8L]